MENPNIFLLNTQEHGGISIAILAYWSDESFLVHHKSWDTSYFNNLSSSLISGQVEWSNIPYHTMYGKFYFPTFRIKINHM